MQYFLLKLYNLQAAFILPSRPLTITKFAIEINQKSMVIRALHWTPLGAHDAPIPQSGLLEPRWVMLLKRLGKPVIE
jgi:hypothetical protein